MAGVLGQTNATLIEVIEAAPLSDSFLSDDFGSGEGEESTSRWSGNVGVWIAPISKTKEATPDGRDEVATRIIHLPNIASLSIGDKLRIETWEGEEVVWNIAAVVLYGEGVELKSSQIYQVEIEVS